MRSWYRPANWKKLDIRDGVDSLMTSLMSRYFTNLPKNRSDIMDEEWDNLLILDACRYDVFEEVNDLPGTLEYRLSNGSRTPEFFEENFGDSKHYDTVYVTANPVPRVDEWCSVNIDTIFHEVIDVWRVHWDEEVNTVRPEPVAGAIRNAHANYPDKRILGHFIQPHQPFIGETGREIEERGISAYDRLVKEKKASGKKVWEQLEDGELSVERAWQAYRENLELVLPHIRDLCDELSGKTVITSDHGNLFGEFVWPFPVRKYGHPAGIHTTNLIKVPWLELEFEEGREIVWEAPENSEAEADEEERLKRLQHLGYR